MHNEREINAGEYPTTPHGRFSYIESGPPIDEHYVIYCGQCKYPFLVNSIIFNTQQLEQSFYCPCCGYYNPKPCYESSDYGMRSSTIRDNMRRQTTDRSDATSASTDITDIDAARERSKSRHPGNKRSDYYASYRGYLRAIHDVNEAITKLIASHRDRFDPWD